jgi:hypothetical protein
VDPGVDLSEADRAAALQLRPIDAARMSDQPRLTELDLLAYLTNDSTYAQVGQGQCWRAPVAIRTGWVCRMG